MLRCRDDDELGPCDRSGTMPPGLTTPLLWPQHQIDFYFIFSRTTCSLLRTSISGKFKKSRSKGFQKGRPTLQSLASSPLGLTYRIFGTCRQEFFALIPPNTFRWEKSHVEKLRKQCEEVLSVSKKHLSQQFILAENLRLASGNITKYWSLLQNKSFLRSASLSLCSYMINSGESIEKLKQLRSISFASTHFLQFASPITPTLYQG